MDPVIYSGHIIRAVFPSLKHYSLSPYRLPVYNIKRYIISLTSTKSGTHNDYSWLVPWLSGRTLIFDRRAFAVLRSTNG